MKSKFLEMLRNKTGNATARNKAGNDRLVEIMRMGEMAQAGYFVMAGDLLEDGYNYAIIMDHDEAFIWNNVIKKWDAVRYEDDITTEHRFPSVAQAWQAVVDHKVPGE